MTRNDWIGFFWSVVIGCAVGTTVVSFFGAFLFALLRWAAS